MEGEQSPCAQPARASTRRRGSPTRKGRPIDISSPSLDSIHIDTKMDTRNRTNAEWGALIETKIAEVGIVNYEITFRLERPSDIARLIDHTALKPESTEAQIDQLCREARKYGFKVTF
jgi:hypothetical protein